MPTFNHEASLRAFSKFQILDDHIQSIILQMLKDDRFNSYGSLKRPPNAWLIFRSDMLATNPEMSTMSQAEVTVRCKSRWAVATLQERMELQARARRASDELLQYFPDYSYKPMSKAEKERWKGLGAHQRKDFWLSSAVRIAERIANPSEPWDGFLTLEKWSEDTPAGSLGTSNNPSLVGLESLHPPEMEYTLASASSPPTHLVSRPQRVCNPTRGPTYAPGSTADQSSTTSARFHPYKKNTSTNGSPVEGHEKGQGRIRRKATKKSLPPAFLRDILVHISSRSFSTQRRRLVLSMFQLKDKMVWVSEVVDDDVPNDVFEQLSGPMNPDETSPDHLVLHDYTDPCIPEAMNKDGELFLPEIGSVSEYHEYMAAYYFAQATSSDFIWPLPRRPPLSPPSVHVAPIDSITTLVQSTQNNPLDFQNSNLLVDPCFNFSTETSPPEMCEPFPSTNLISDSDSDSVTTPEEDPGWDEPIPIDIVEGLDDEEFEDSEFNFE